MKSCLIVVVLAAVAQAAPQYNFLNPISIPTVLPDGHLADTPEVQAAKAFHFAEVAKALANDPDTVAVATPVVAPAAAPAATVVSAAAPSPYYANPVVTSEGFVADTAEVSKAKALHYAAHAAALGAPLDPYLKYLDLNFPY